MYDELKKILTQSDNIVFSVVRVSVRKVIFRIFDHRAVFTVRRPIRIVQKR